MARRSSLPRPLPILLTLVALLAAGCGGNSFVGKRFDNFTAYYNKFYNARHAFERGVTALERQDQPVDRDLFLPLFTNPGMAANSAEFENAILKSADVLRKHPTSKWVDDALLVIGKSYFYQQNYVGAEQKFREVIAIGSGLADEARFWLARSLIASGSYDQATEHLTVTLTREDLSPRWEPKLRLALGELYIRRQAWEEAATQLADGLANVRENDLGARAQFLLGQVLEQLERYDESVAAYEAVARFNPVYELAYAAQVSAIRVEGLHGDAEAAMHVLRRMERDDKNYAYRYDLAYLRARILQGMGRADESLAIYHDILYDADVPVTAQRGRVHYALGELHRDLYRDFLMAAAHFDTSATARQGAPAATGGRAASQVFYAPAAITDAAEQAERFGSFAEVQGEIARMDSLLALGSLDDEAFATRILELRRQLALEIAAQQREAERRETMQRFADNAVTDVQTSRGGQAADQVNASAGFLFHKDPVVMQQNRIEFQNVWGDRPHVPNWRRADAIVAVAGEQGAAGAGVQRRPDAAGAGVAEALPVLDYSDVPRDPASRAEMLAERAMARYELGNVLFLGMSRPDSAAAWYRLVIEEDGDQPVAQRAYYALAEVQRALGDTAAARRLYEHVLEAYPESDFADRVRERLGQSRAAGAPSDTLALAEQSYDEAYRRWRRGAYAEALDAMLRTAALFPSTEVAPRALMAAGTIYMEWAERDSLDLYAPLPVRLPDSLREAVRLLAAQDSTAAGSAGPAVAAEPPADTLAAAPADSLGVQAPAAATPLAAAEADGLYLRALYDGISANFPQSPYAQQAARVLSALSELRPAPAPDTTAADVALAANVPDSTAQDHPPAAIAPDAASTAGADSAAVASVPPSASDSLASDSLASDAPASDSLAVDAAASDSTASDPVPPLEAALTDERRLFERRGESREPAATPDTEAAPDEGEAAPEEGTSKRELIERREEGEAPRSGAPVPEGADPALFGGEPVDPAAGGWTLVVSTGTERQPVEELVNGLRYRGYRTALLSEALGGAELFRAVVGQFESHAKAREALREHGGQFPSSAAIQELQVVQ